MTQLTLRLRPNEKSLREFLKDISLQLRGKRLSRVRRSIGSVLLFDFGELGKFGKKKRLFGEWHLLVLMASWIIVKKQKVLLSSEEPPSKIDEMISPLLKGRETKTFIFRRSGSLELTFTDGTKLNVKKTRIKNYRENWSLFCRDVWSVSNADENDMYRVD